MSQPYRDVPASLPRSGASAITPALRQNVDGDVVVPAEVGEIVLLPRLWGFELAFGADGRIELVHPDGLIASADLDRDGAVRLTEVVVATAAQRYLPLAAS